MQKATRNTVPALKRLVQLTEEEGNAQKCLKKKNGQSVEKSGLLFKEEWINSFSQKQSMKVY